MQPEEYSVIPTGQQKDADNACYDVVQSVVVVVVLLSLIWLFNKQQQQQPQHYKALAERTDEHEYSTGRVRRVYAPFPLSLSFCEDASLERLELAVRQRQKLFTFCGGSCCCCLFVVPPKRRQLGQQASCPYRLYEICHVRRAAHSGKVDSLMYNNNNFKYCILFIVIQIRLLLNYNTIFLFHLCLYL